MTVRRFPCVLGLHVALWCVVSRRVRLQAFVWGRLMSGEVSSVLFPPCFVFSRFSRWFRKQARAPPPEEAPPQARSFPRERPSSETAFPEAQTCSTGRPSPKAAPALSQEAPLLLGRRPFVLGGEWFLLTLPRGRKQYPNHHVLPNPSLPSVHSQTRSFHTHGTSQLVQINAENILFGNPVCRSQDVGTLSSRPADHATWNAQHLSSNRSCSFVAL